VQAVKTPKSDAMMFYDRRKPTMYLVAIFLGREKYCGAGLVNHRAQPIGS
jgi:hypothetical protein